ncbi:hypothetical protein ABIA33_004231 [Streptacidiphilus sp. MAP12-16]|uniref:hypothetical protein n=1 Tax=Streptacidiphilus sp. MAP12-16 TaxID=3156300 RepID=UPI003517BA21
MNDFERELTRMMRDTQQDTPFGQDDRARLRSGVRRRRRARAAWMAAGSALAVAVIGASTLVLSDAFATVGHSSPATAPSAPSTTPSTAPSLISVLRHDIPSSSGRVDAGTTADSFIVTSPQGVKTYLGIAVRTYNDAMLKFDWSCSHAHAKDGGGAKTLGCTQLAVDGGSGWEISWVPSPGLQANFVEYAAPYKNGWVSVVVENCNALRSCDTGSGDGGPAMAPTTAKPPLGMALLRQIGLDPDVISTAAKPLPPRGPGVPSSAAMNSAAPGSAAPTPSIATPSATLPPMPTGAARAAVLAAIRDVDALLTHNETKAISAARRQCAVLAGGVANPDAAAARNFSYDGITLAPTDGTHLNYALRRTLCP